MTKNKNNTSVWNTRIKKSSSLFQKVGSSISFDKRLFKEDIQASIAHVEMLFKKKIITECSKSLLRPNDVTLQIPSSEKFLAKTNWKQRIPLSDSLEFLLNFWREKAQNDF